MGSAPSRAADGQGRPEALEELEQLGGNCLLHWQVTQPAWEEEVTARLWVQRAARGTCVCSDKALQRGKGTGRSPNHVVPLGILARGIALTGLDAVGKHVFGRCSRCPCTHAGPNTWCLSGPRSK